MSFSFFSGGSGDMSSINYTRLKTNLSLAIQRLKLLEKKKTEAAARCRKEIAEYIENGKVERAKIRVEQVIREDYLVEAMEIVEMFCDLLLTRFGMIQQMNTLDDGLEEAVSSLIWVAPRMSTECKELKIIGDLFTQKYGKQFAQKCKDNTLKSVNEKLMLKLGVQAPPKILIEKYLIEISKILGVAYEPDEEVLIEDKKFTGDDDDNKGSGSSGGGAGQAGQSKANPDSVGMLPGLLIDFKDPNAKPTNNAPPALPSMPPSAPQSDYDYLSKHLKSDRPPQIGFIDLPPQPNSTTSSVPPSYDSVINQPPPAAAPAAPSLDEEKSAPTRTYPDINLDNLPSVPNLPDVPNDDFSPSSRSNFGGGGGDVPSSKPKDNNDDAPNQDDVDFDDLRRRFEDLKNRK